MDDFQSWFKPDYHVQNSARMKWNKISTKILHTPCSSLKWLVVATCLKSTFRVVFLADEPNVSKLNLKWNYSYETAHIQLAKKWDLFVFSWEKSKAKDALISSYNCTKTHKQLKCHCHMKWLHSFLCIKEHNRRTNMRIKHRAKY